MIIGIANIQRAVGAAHETEGLIELGLMCWPAIACIAGLACTRESGDARLRVKHHGQAGEKRIHHEETKSTKEETRSLDSLCILLRALRFFVVAQRLFADHLVTFGQPAHFTVKGNHPNEC